MNSSDRIELLYKDGHPDIEIVDIFDNDVVIRNYLNEEFIITYDDNEENKNCGLGVYLYVPEKNDVVLNAKYLYWICEVVERFNDDFYDEIINQLLLLRDKNNIYCAYCGDRCNERSVKIPDEEGYETYVCRVCRRNF